ncbi:MAG TPA: Gfo/Idh/MocA family oxidoreductase [Bryobacteraceae bacterium]
MSGKLRIGVIGLGVMGEQYVRIYQNHPLAEVTAVAARNPEKTAAVAAKYGVAKVCGSWQELIALPDVDAVCVATPDDAHYEPARAAMEAGKHVLIEKPMTTDLAQADTLVRIAQSTCVKVQVAYNHRWLAPYYQGHTAIEAGSIGRPLSAYARKNDTIFVPTEYINWAAQTTSAWFLSCHDIDLVCWYLKSEPLEARAWGVKQVLAARGIDTYDTIHAQVRFASGAIATFESGWIYPNTFPAMVESFVEVLGESGVLHFDRKREGIELASPQAYTYPKTFLTANVFGSLRGAFPSCLDDFVRAIRDDTPTGVGVVDGRQVTAVLTAIHESLHTGNTVPVPPLTRPS